VGQAVHCCSAAWRGGAEQGKTAEESGTNPQVRDLRGCMGLEGSATERQGTKASCKRRQGINPDQAGLRAHRQPMTMGLRIGYTRAVFPSSS